MSDNPFTQVQDYVKELRRAGEASRFDGKMIRAIDPDTPFMCQVIADDTPSLRDVMDRLNGFYKKAGSKSYYRWDSHFRIFMEVTSYSDLISGSQGTTRRLL
ncbi:MAG: hypothetical protein P8Q92_12600 [Pseudoprimorskyibacter sp.]|nr:hypothetical protein [Pseudoprimorskyibacter sp.]